MTTPDQRRPQDGTRRIKLVLEYDGTAFNGWQAQQQGQRTVQATLEGALAPFGMNGRVIAAGRTDAGVHALAMTAHADIAHAVTATQLHRALNARLPDDVRVLACSDAPEGFHARFSCQWRSYRYRILNAPTASALERSRALWIPQRLEVAPMHHAGEWLLGRHNFAAFATQEERQPVRELYECVVRSLPATREVHRRGQQIEVRVTGESFLRHMVRGIVGTLLEVGLGKLESGALRRILQSGERAQAGPNLPAHGLYFLEAGYEAWR